MKKGEVLVFDSSLIHRSSKMLSEIKRIAVGGYVIPRMASLVHYHMNESDYIEEYQIDEEFFIKYYNGDKPDTSYNCTSRFKWRFGTMNEYDRIVLYQLADISKVSKGFSIGGWFKRWLKHGLLHLSND